MGYDFNPLAMQTKNNARDDSTSIGEVVETATMDRVQFATTLDVVNAIADIEPDSEVTLSDVVMDVAGGEGCDDEALKYVVGVTYDFIQNLGVSRTSIDDLFSSNDDIAMDEIHAVASLLNEVTADSIDTATLVSMSMDNALIADTLEIDGDVTLDSITMDWAFGKEKSSKNLRTGTGHTMKVVRCHRTINSESKAGYCRYPKTLLKGKYKKAKGVSDEQKNHLANIILEAHTEEANKRRASNMALTRKGSKKEKARA